MKVAGPERSIEKSFVDWCKNKHNLVARKLREDKRNGFPDRSIFLPGGRIVCVEFKAPKGTLDSAQITRIAELTADGVPVLVTSDLKEAKEWLLEQMSKSLKSGPLTGTSKPLCSSCMNAQC